MIVEENLDIKSGYKVQLRFAENPWFSNNMLEKAVRYSEDGSAELTSVPPQWYPGKVSPEAVALHQQYPPKPEKAQVPQVVSCACCALLQQHCI